MMRFRVAVMAGVLIAVASPSASSAGVVPEPAPGVEVGPASEDSGAPSEDGDGPEALVALSGIAEIDGGALHTCARLANGTARCWGWNDDGRVGDGTTMHRRFPHTVRHPSGTGPLSGIVEIDTGGAHTCARLANGTARCWGYNNMGQLGDGTITDRFLPVTVSNTSGTGPLTGVVELDAGEAHTCARLINSTMVCWGYNGNGELGTGGTSEREPLPLVVSNTAGTGPLFGVAAITTGQVHSCAALNDGTARCWGYNFDGQLGDGTTTGRLLPKPVRNPSGGGLLSGVVGISASFSHTCAALSDGTARCWGYNGSGQLGDGTVIRRLRPVAVVDTADGGALTGIVAAEVGRFHACARLTDGTVRCWGSNGVGQLGDGSPYSSVVPVTVKNQWGTGVLASTSAVATGDYHSCVVMSDTTARCWGYNMAGILGNGGWQDRRLPVVVRRGS